MFDLTIKYDNGDEDSVTAGQREMAAWEMAGHGSSVSAADDKPMLFFRFLAYAALKRLRRLPTDGNPPRPQTYDAWSDGVDEVLPPDEEVEADPTTPDQPQKD